MAIDLEQFHQVFFEESIEGLDIMESSLMELDPASIDAETINAIFRCAHSIKGGSATFGFSSISDFTHILETLLDQVRSGERDISTDEVNLFLQSVDCMREMLSLIQSGEDGVTEQSISLKDDFTRLLEGGSVSKANSVSNTPKDSSEAKPVDVSQRNWSIQFVPNEGIFLSGNDPFKILEALSLLGDTEIKCLHDNLPKLESLDSEKCYLHWNIELTGSASENDIREVFEWVEDDCELVISAVESLPTVADCVALQQWHIQFIPGPDILRTGNEPMRLFRALKELGDLKSVDVDFSKLPTLHSIDSESCYLSWSLVLEAEDIDQQDIESVFEWVEDEAEIKIELAAAASQSLSEPSQVEVPAEVSSAASKANDVNVPESANKPKVKKAATENASIRVGIDKVDNLINMVGELVITQSMLGQLGTDFDIERIPKLIEGLGQLEQNTRELQESVMKIRMLPISFAFSRFPRMIRDLSQTLGKSVDLEMNGEKHRTR